MLDHSALSAGPGPLVLLLFALALDAYIGDPPLLYRLIPHPVTLMGRLVAGFERRLNRRERSDRDRAWRGFLTAIAVDSEGTGYVVDRTAEAIYSYDDIGNINGAFTPDRTIQGAQTLMDGPIRVFLEE